MGLISSLRRIHQNNQSAESSLHFLNCLIYINNQIHIFLKNNQYLEDVWKRSEVTGVTGSLLWSKINSVIISVQTATSSSHVCVLEKL